MPAAEYIAGHSKFLRAEYLAISTKLFLLERLKTITFYSFYIFPRLYLLLTAAPTFVFKLYTPHLFFIQHIQKETNVCI
jgi:hypothetical protein